MPYYILHSIVYNKVTYSRGERPPNELTEIELRTLFENGMIGKIMEDGSIMKFSKPVHLSDDEINRMAAWPAPDVLHYVKVRNLHAESIKRITELIKLPPATKAAINKILATKEANN